MEEAESPVARPDALAVAGTGARVEVVYALPERQRVVVLALPAEGFTAAEAVERSGLPQEFPEIASRPLTLGVYGAICDGSRPLRDGDRVEIYRPLRHDPRSQRRERAATAPRKGRPRQR